MDESGPPVYDIYLLQSQGRASIARQRREITQHIEQIGGQVGREFCDKDQTAYRKIGAQRPEREDFNALLAWSASHPGRRIGTWHADRLIRDGGDAERMIHDRPPGERLIVETRGGGTYDLGTALGRKRLRDDATAAAYEVDHAIERIRMFKLEAAAEGKWSGGPRPFGYEGIPAAPGEEGKFSGLAVKETEATLIREAATAILSGSSLNAIAAQWRAAGSTGTRGGAWTGSRVRQVLIRPSNAGMRIHQGAEVGDGDWPAILDRDVFRAVCAILSDPGRKVTPGPERRWLGAGFYECGICHGKLHTHHGGWVAGKGLPSRPVYACPGHVSRAARHLDAWIGDLAAARLATADQGQAPRGREQPDTEALHAQLVTHRKRLEERSRLHQQGVIDTAELIAGSIEGKKEIAAIEARLREAVRASPLTGMPDAGPEEIRGWWDGLHVSRQRTIAAELFAYVRVMPAAHRGKPRGIRRGDPYFDREAIEHRWR